MDPAASQSAPYRVLARTYRPTRLSELIGQEALVRTLKNAFASGRIAHAFVLTGIRGVGKTTTARIVAKGLNCVGPDGTGGPTPEPCGACPSCRAIGEDRSLDVIELDAASHSGKGEMHELMEGVAFMPSSSRFKVYILDEVHMLSTQAWNSLLKTVEEPPAHVKFIFATTELRRVPVTVLSRCQRFDLRRVPPDALASHLSAICAREGVEAAGDALALVARAAEGSVRDGLSLLDQAIALSDGPVGAATVQAMLGLGDRLKVVELFAAIVRGAAPEVLDRVEELHGLGADPLALVQDLLEVCHALSRVKVRPAEAAGAAGFIGEAAALARELAAELSLPVLARAWQMLLRGAEEVRIAPDGAAAAEMLLLRLACVSDLPPPSELARLARGGGGAPQPEPARPRPAAAPMTGGNGLRPVSGALAMAAAPVVEAARAAPPAAATAGPARPPVAAAGPAEPGSFAELVAMIAASGERLIAAFLYEETRLIRFEPGRIELRLGPAVPPDLPSRLAAAAGKLTGRRWIVAVGQGEGQAPLAAQAADHKRRRIAELGADPGIKGLLEAFPGAEIVDVRATEAASAAMAAATTGATAGAPPGDERTA